MRIFCMMLIATILAVLPYPVWCFSIQPLWVLLGILYIQFYTPSYFRVSVVFGMGLVLDVLLITPLGQHGFGFLVVCLLASYGCRRFVLLSMREQVLWVMGLCLVFEVVMQIIDMCFGNLFNKGACLLFPGMGAIAWPWLVWSWDGWLRSDPLKVRNF